MYIPPSGTTMHCQHTWIAYIDNTAVGHIALQDVTTGGYNIGLGYLDAWVDNDYRRQGIFRMLWDTRWNFVGKKFQGYKVYAWCLPKSLPLLKNKGFIEGDTCVYVERIVTKENELSLY